MFDWTPRCFLLMGAQPLLVAGCGPGHSASSVVGTRVVSGGATVLVDARGEALYSPQQEPGGTVLCVGPCATVWPPFVLAKGVPLPNDTAGLTGIFGTVTRPDGTIQLTFDGHPRYRFSYDRAPGQDSGNGTHDDFGGIPFTWSVITADGSTPTPPASGTGSASSGGSSGYGGY